MTYGISVVDLYRRAADYVDRILQGARPADLKVPPSLLLRADEVLE